MAALTQGLNIAKIATFIALEAPVRPRWAYQRLRGYTYSNWLNRYHRKRLAEYRTQQRPLHEGLAYVLDRPLDEVRHAGENELLANLEIQDRWVVGLGRYARRQPMSDGPIEVRYGPSPAFMTIISIVCTLQRPEVVVETGVARGFSTCATLDALARNGKGHLWSVELPSLHIGFARQVGEVIPDSLRDRWTLEIGPSALVLPRLGKRLGAIDVFIHDSAANYDNQRSEFAAALACMPAGGVLISDMLNNDAFLEVTERIDCRWTVIEQNKPNPVGVLCKLS